MPLILIALIALVGAGVGWFKSNDRCACPYRQRAEPARMLPAADADAKADWRTRCRTELERARDRAGTSNAPVLREGNVTEVTLFADDTYAGQSFVEYELVRDGGQLYQVSVAEETDENHKGLDRWSHAIPESLPDGQVRFRTYLHRNGLLVSLHGEGDAPAVREFVERFGAAIDACTTDLPRHEPIEVEIIRAPVPHHMNHDCAQTH